MGTTIYSTGWLEPSSVITKDYENDGYTWYAMDNIKDRDNSGGYSDGLTSSIPSEYLIMTGYGANIPSNAQIIGIQVRSRRKNVRSGGLKDYDIRLRNGVTTSKGALGNNQAKTALYTSSYVDVTYGSANDTMGATLTPAIVNSSTFGAYFRCKGTSSTVACAYVDCIDINITYAITTVDINNNYYGANEIPYEISKPTKVTTDVFVRDYTTNTSDISKITYDNTEKAYKILSVNQTTTNVVRVPFFHKGYNRGTGSSSLVTNFMPITPNIKKTVQKKIKAPNNIQAGVYIAFYDSTGTYISNSNIDGTIVVGDGTTYKVAQVTAIAPTNAAGYVIGIYFPSDIGTGTVYVKEIQVNTGDFINYVPSIIHITDWLLPYNQTANTGDGTRIAWSNLGNINDVNETNYASVSLPTTKESQAAYSVLNPSLVNANNVLLGMMVQLDAYSSGGSLTEQVYCALKVNSASSSDRELNTPLGNTDTYFLYGGWNDNWDSELTASNIIAGNSDISIVFRNEDTVTRSVYYKWLKYRLLYTIQPQIETYIPNLNPLILDTNVGSVYQAATKYDFSVNPLKLNKRSISIQQDTGFIGIVPTDRGHEYPDVERTNDLTVETVSGASNYSKKGVITEKKPLKISILAQYIKALEGYVDMDEILPVNTVTGMDDNDPYIHRGYIIIDSIKHSRTNALRSSVELGATYVSKDLKAPLMADYLIRTDPPIDYDIATNLYTSVLYLPIDQIQYLLNYCTTSHTGVPTITGDDNGLSIQCGAGVIAKFTSNNVSNSNSCIFSTNITFTKPSGAYEVQLGLIDNVKNLIVGALFLSSNNIVLKTYESDGSTTKQIFTYPATVATGTNYLEMYLYSDIDGNIYGEVGITNDSGSYMTVTDSLNMTYATSKSLKSRLRISESFSVVTTYLDFATNLFGIVNDEDSVRNVITIPKPDSVNLPYDFIRNTASGQLYCYLNPIRDIIFNTNPNTFYMGDAKLTVNGSQITSADMAIDCTNDEVILENDVIRLVFDTTTKTVSVYGFFYGWIFGGVFSLDNMYHIKAKNVSFESITLVIGETEWNIRRGQPFVYVKHPYDDLGIVTLFGKVWHDNGSGIGIEENISAGSMPITINDIFYCNLYNTNGDLGLQIFRSDGEDIQANLIPASNETGIGWYAKSETTHESHSSRALEWLAKPVSSIQVYI